VLSFALTLSTSLVAEMRDDYDLTVAVVVKALDGWQLYEDKKFAGSFNNGYYTDPDPDTQGYEFWSDGLIAKLDRDSNGHHETFFVVVEDQLVYVGSIGGKGTFVHVANEFKECLGRPIGPSILDIRKKRAS